MERRTDYVAKVIGTLGKDLTAREKIAMKKFDDCMNLEGGININLECMTIVEVHNEHVKDGDNTDYTVYVLKDVDGMKYKTSSESLYDSIVDMAFDLEAEGEQAFPMDIKICETKSKNNQGNFLTAVLI